MPDSTSHNGGWDDADWDLILYAIYEKQCTPFLGAGACAGILPLGGELAAEWARQYEYPFRKDRGNLTRVAQYVAVERGEDLPKRLIRNRFARQIGDEFYDKAWPVFSNLDEPHRVVASLRLPVYITTNYDSFMVRALEYLNLSPRQEVCRWYEAGRRMTSRAEAARDDGERPLPSPEQPVVYHLHGHLNDLWSMVLTEDDYLDFLMNVSKYEETIPSYIQAAFQTTAFLFIGYSLEDINFRFLFRRLAETMRGRSGKRHVSVQIQPRQYESQGRLRQRAQKQLNYLKSHFGAREVKVFWGTAEDFAKALRERWEVFLRDR